MKDDLFLHVVYLNLGWSLFWGFWVLFYIDSLWRWERHYFYNKLYIDNHQHLSPYCHLKWILICLVFVFRYFWWWHLRIYFNCSSKLVLGRSSSLWSFSEFYLIVRHCGGVSVANVFIRFFCWFPWKHISFKVCWNFVTNIWQQLICICKFPFQVALFFFYNFYCFHMIIIMHGLDFLFYFNIFLSY